MTTINEIEIEHTECLECPICMDDIDLTKNYITTECGHTFHASCVMRNIVSNGFACPLCRTMMADEPEEDESTIVSDFEQDEEEEEMGSGHEEEMRHEEEMPNDMTMESRRFIRRRFK